MEAIKKEIKKAKTKLYLACGSNLIIGQMFRRCPKAKVAGKTELKGWRMEFRGSTGNGVATIVKTDDATSLVPCALWRTTGLCEEALDRYEGFPRLYRKERISCVLEGKEVEAYVYIMNDVCSIARPSLYYYNTIAEGYRNFGFDKMILDKFVEETLREIENKNG